MADEQNDIPGDAETGSASPIMFKMSELPAILEKMANGTRSPTALIAGVFVQSGRSEVAEEQYEAIRQRLLNTPIRAPNGNSYKVPSLQTQYLRYYVVEYLHRHELTYQKSYERAAEILKDPSGNTLTPETIRDSRHYIKKQVLTSDAMRTFCQGLEYDFPVAMARGKPEPHTYFDPEIHLATEDVS